VTVAAPVVAVVIRIADAAVLAIAAAAALALVVAVVAAWRARRAQVRRVATLALRLEDTPPATESRRLDKNMTRLERAVDTAVLARGDATIAAARLARALDAVAQGIVIADEAGRTVVQNEVARVAAAERTPDRPVGAVIDDLIGAALDGRTGTRTIELFGTPRRTFVISASPIDDERRTIGALAVVDDITERRRLEAVRRDFVANVSHELKTPVAALSVLAETLVAEHDPAVIRRISERIVGDAARLARMIDDLLELSRIEAEQVPVREPVPVHLAVAEAVEQVRPAAEQRGVDVVVAEARHSLTVTGDRRQIVAALFNLLDNAVKYSRPGSSVEVRAAVSVNGDRVAISVRDEGVGIPEHDHDRIFERFFRVDRGQGEVPGTGLGLAIVRHVADNLGGEVRLDSREGAGSTFTLVLPAGPPLTPGAKAG